ncbi:hypothetical protein LEN26_018584 [Aphanomyces euteiches]|nr:hypothetical protein LEN26_018584 [Aphanomyces euteiches]KAH9107241.1 hypothetical protein AeMF1_017369 [Aphanomyces euteiches]
MSRGTSDDDMALLVQANNERPFLHERVMKAWDELAINPLQIRDQDHNDRHILLNQLLALRTDSLVRKKSKQQANTAEREEKSRTEDAARHIRDQAMKTCQKREAVNSDNDKDDKPATPSKKTLLVNFRNEEVQLDRERLVFKKENLKLEIEEKRLDRLERHEVREKERKQLEDLHNQMSEV